METTAKNKTWSCFFVLFFLTRFVSQSEETNKIVKDIGKPLSFVGDLEPSTPRTWMLECCVLLLPRHLRRRAYIFAYVCLGICLGVPTICLGHDYTYALTCLGICLGICLGKFLGMPRQMLRHA